MSCNLSSAVHTHATILQALILDHRQPNLLLSQPMAINADEKPLNLLNAQGLLLHPHQALPEVPPEAFRQDED